MFLYLTSSAVPGTLDWQRIVDKGYFRKNADPLLHNKLTFPYLCGNFPSQDFEAINDLANEALK